MQVKRIALDVVMKRHDYTLQNYQKMVKQKTF